MHPSQIIIRLPQYAPAPTGQVQPPAVWWTGWRWQHHATRQLAANGSATALCGAVIPTAETSATGPLMQWPACATCYAALLALRAQ